MTFEIDTASRLPIYQQLANQIRQGVARGSLKPGDKLPSVRELSRELIVNPNTIARAFAELERDGTLNPRPGLGVFVAEPKAEFTKEVRKQKLVEMLDKLLTEAVHLGFSAEEVAKLVTQRSKKFHWTPSA